MSEAIGLSKLQPATGWSWFVSGLGIGQICSWGALYYSFPLIAEAMQRRTGWGNEHATTSGGRFSARRWRTRRHDLIR